VVLRGADGNGHWAPWHHLVFVSVGAAQYHGGNGYHCAYLKHSAVTIATDCAASPLITGWINMGSVWDYAGCAASVSASLACTDGWGRYG